MSVPAHAREAQLIAVALTLGTLGAGLFLFLPGFVGALQHLYGFNEAQLGDLSSAHLMGLTLGTALGAPLMTRFGIRKTVAWALASGSLANAAAIPIHAYRPLLALVLCTGAGAGIAIASCFVVLGQSRQVERGFSLYNITQLLFGAAALQWLPAISDRVGVSGLFASLAILYAASLLPCRSLPAAMQTVSKETGTQPTPIPAWLALAAIVIFFAGQGAVWAYLELIGVQGGLPRQTVASAVALSSVVALIGPTVAVLMVSKWGRVVPLSVGLALCLTALYLLGSAQEPARFVSGACLFNLAWNLSSCYPPAVVAGADASGRLMKWVAFATLLGVAAGPFLGARVIGAKSLAGVLWLGAALSLLSFAAFMPACARRIA